MKFASTYDLQRNDFMQIRFDWALEQYQVNISASNVSGRTFKVMHIEFMKMIMQIIIYT